MKIKDIFHAVFTLVIAFTSKVKNILAPTKAELQAVATEFATKFDIKDDELEVKIEIAIALIAEGYSVIQIAVTIVKDLLSRKAIASKV